MAHIHTKIHPCKLCGAMPHWVPTRFSARAIPSILACVNKDCLNPHTQESMADQIGQWNRMMALGEIDAATVERCAQVAIRLNGWGSPPRPDIAEHIASAIRSLIPNSANEIHSSDGLGLVQQEAGTAREAPRSTTGCLQRPNTQVDARPSEALHAHQPMMPKYEYQKDASQSGSVAYRDPVVTQDCAPAEAGLTAEGRVDYRKFAEWVGLSGRMPNDAALALYLEIELDNREEVDAIEAAVIREACEALRQRYRLTRSAVSEEELSGYICWASGSSLRRALCDKIARALLSTFNITRKV